VINSAHKLKFPDAKILVFCKAPIPGTVKTRLLSVLNPCEAADLYRKLARRMLDCAIDSSLADVELWCFPDVSHTLFQQYEDRGVPLFQQQGTDLGERMYQAALHSLAQEGVSKVLIIGADCPTLDEHYLETALSKLDDHDAVLGPAEDGGYGLIGLRKADPAVFSDITWSTSEVCADTCKKMNKLNYNWSLLPLIWDVDRPEDLTRLDHT
jgi:rSAM/selenodomain-associated transferase 1